MHTGDIVFFKVRKGYIKYIVRHIIDDELFVLSFKSKQANCIDVKDAVKYEDFVRFYNNEEIFE